MHFSAVIGQEQQVSVFDNGKIEDLSVEKKQIHCFVTSPNLSVCHSYCVNSFEFPCKSVFI